MVRPLTESETKVLYSALTSYADKVGKDKVLSMHPYVVHEKIQEIVYKERGDYIPMETVVTFPIQFKEDK